MLLSDPAPPTGRLQVAALNQRAFELRHSDARLALAQQARGLALALDDQHGLATALLRVGVCQLILGEPASDGDHGTGHHSLLLQALALLTSLGDVRGQAEAHKLLGHVHGVAQAHELALQSFERCLALSLSIGDPGGEVDARQNLGLVLRDLGQLPEALDQAEHCLRLASAAGLPDRIAYAHCAVGAVLSSAGELALAQQHFERGLALVRQTSDRALESTLLFNLGRLLTDAGQPQAALAHLSLAFDLAQRTGNRGDQALALLGLGLVQQALGQPALGQPLLADGLVLARRKGDGELCAQLLLAQASGAMAQQQPRQALPLLAQALQLAEAARAVSLQATAHQRLSQAHQDLGDLAPALHHHQAFHAAYRQANDQATQRRVRAVLSQQALAQAQQDAQAERARNAELAQALDDAHRAAQDRTALLAELQAQAALLQQLAREDGLTGVANRRWLDLQLRREVERAQRFGHPLAVAMIDLDHFKAVNDRCGHAVGDEVLRQVARLLRQGCRASDGVGRYGGEEFVLLLVETTAAQALALCDTLRLRVAAQPWAALHPALAAGLTVSIGVAALAGDEPPEALLARSDAALYRAKHGGRNRVCG